MSQTQKTMPVKKSGINRVINFLKSETATMLLLVITVIGEWNAVIDDNYGLTFLWLVVTLVGLLRLNYCYDSKPSAEEGGAK